MTTSSKALNNLILELKELPDARRGEGQRHKQEVVLIIVLFATMSGYFGYRAMGDFAKKHKTELIELLEIKKSRIPSFSTIRRVLMKVCIKSFEGVYKKWLQELEKDSSACSSDCSDSEAVAADMELKDWYSGDGKFIRGANKSRDSSEQINLVSIFSSFHKVVYQSEAVAIKSNEIPCVQKMIQASDLEGIILTLDPLHCQKKLLSTLNKQVMTM